MRISLKIESEDEEGNEFDRELRKAILAIDPRLVELEQDG